VNGGLWGRWRCVVHGGCLCEWCLLGHGGGGGGG